jgi:hypothetical protein
MTPTPEPLAEVVEQVRALVDHLARGRIYMVGSDDIADLETLLSALQAKDAALIAAEYAILGLLTTSPSEAAINAGQAWILSRAAATTLGD